jgi:N-acetylglucosamine malate deacetylase 1
MNVIVKSLLRRFARMARPHLRSVGLLQTAGMFARSTLVWTPGNERVVVLAPHMDDETIGCGGTIALHAQRGAKIDVIFMTDGRNGGGLGSLEGDARQRRQLELISMRKQEGIAALATLGVKDFHCLEICDGRLAHEATRAALQLRALLERLRPSLVYLPMFSEEHSDHRATSAVLMQAVKGTPLNFQCAGYEVWTALTPNCFVDVTTTMQIKRRAVASYRSQLEDADYEHAIVGLNAYRSMAFLNARGSYAEAFFMCSLKQYTKAYGEFMHALQGRSLVSASSENFTTTTQSNPSAPVDATKAWS